MHTGTRKFALGILIIIVAIALGAAVILTFLSHKAAPTGTTAASGTASTQYTSATYGYSFSYPPAYAVKEYTPALVAIGTPGGSDAFATVAEVDFLAGSSSDRHLSYEGLAYAAAMNDCAADGPNGSVRCTDIERHTPFVGANGISGQEFYLTQVTTTKDGVSTTVRGPFYALDLFSTASKTKSGALLVRIPLTGNDGSSAAVVSQIANTVQVAASATPAASHGN